MKKKAVEAGEEPASAPDTPVKASGVTSEGLQVAMPHPRKLSKADKSKVTHDWTGPQVSKTRDAMMAGMVQVAKDKFGTGKVYGSQQELAQLVVGIPTPSLAFEWLIGNDIFPLSVTIMLAGLWGTCKSVLSYEFFRWVWECNGMPFHFDTEKKFDAPFAAAVMRCKDEKLPFVSNRAGSVEVLQEMLTHYFTEMMSLCTGTKEDPGPGKTVPMIFCVDSLAAAVSEETKENVRKTGSAGRGHPVEALKNTRFLKVFKEMISEWPTTLVIVNHLKQQTDDNGHKSDYTPGGQVFNFLESFELHTRKWKSKIETSSFDGIGITLSCVKNSFGPTGRRIRTRFLWWVEDDENGQPRDVTVWDWNWALCTLLNELDGKDKARLKERGLGISVKSPAADVECLANFPAIGMGKGEYASFQEVGQRIQNNPEVCNSIRDALNIQRRYKLVRSLDEIVRAHNSKVK